MIRILPALVAVLAVAGEGLAGDKETAAKAKAKAKACASLSLDRVASQPIGPQSRTSPVAPLPATAEAAAEVPVVAPVPPAPRERFVIVSTTWCGPCQLLKVRELPALRKAYAVEEVDGDLVKSHGVTSYPTVIFERDGREAWRVTGYTAAETLKALAAQK